MQLARSIAVLLFLSAPALWAQATPESPATGVVKADDCHEEGKDPICSRAEATFQALIAAEQKSLAAGGDVPPTTDVLHCFLDLELNFSTLRLSGSNTLQIKSLVAGLTSISLDLRDNMTVSAVTVGSQSAAFSRANHKIAITLDRAYAAGETFTVKVTYSGQPQSLGWRSFMFYSSIAASLSQPWYAHTWWPCKDELDDKFTMEFWITVPAGKIAVSNGVRLGTDTLSGNRVRYRWREDYPIATYLVSVAAANYSYLASAYNHPGGSMPVELYSLSLTSAGAQSVMDHMVTAIATFSRPDVFGPYPFISEKYGVAEFSGQVNMEHQTISSHHSYDLNIIDHEMAHQWWGDMITCRTWHDIWLNEGFATYSEAVQEEFKPGGSFQAYQARMAYRRPSDYSGSVYVYDTTSQSDVFSSNLVYKKGAWVLHMLRHVVGDQAFFNTLSAYRSAYAGGSATTAEFQAVAETVYGSDLSWFFNQWVYGTGAPTYAYGWQYVENAGKKELLLHIRQVQTSSSLFRMPIDVSVTTAGGTTTHVVWQEYETHWYRLEVDGPVSSVVLDPNSFILHGNTMTEAYTPAPRFRLLLTSPVPGAAGSAAMRINDVTLFFEQHPTYTDDQITVTGSVSGARPFTSAYNPSSRALQLRFAQPLPANELWTVRLRDQIYTTVTGEVLDGEVTSTTTSSGLPSGDGTPGGDAVFTFFTAFPGDFDGDLDVDLEDFGPLQACLGEPGVHPVYSSCLTADLDHDQDVDMADLALFQTCMTNAGVKPATTCGN